MPEIDMGNGNLFDAENNSMNQSDHEFTIAQAVMLREQELYQYQLNIFNYENMLGSMGELATALWPQNLQSYRGMSRDKLAESIVNDEDLELASQLSFRDEIKIRIRTEKMELNKVKFMLNSLVSQCLDIPKLRARIAELKSMPKG